MGNTITKEVAEKVKADKGLARVLCFGNEYGEALFRHPTDGEYQRFVAELSDSDTKPSALRTLVLACAVYPEEQDFLVMIRQYPGLVQTFGGELVEAAGLKKATVKKEF